MRRICLGTVVLLIAAIAQAQEPAAGCEYHVEPLPEKPVSESTLKVLGMNPADGGDVRKDTVIAVDVEYHIKGFRSGEFLLATLFSTLGNGAMIPDAVAERPPLTSASGKVRLCVPLQEPYDHPTLVWPMTMYVNLMQRDPRGFSRSVASSRNVKFNALDIPQAALERQRNQPPVEYFDSLRMLTGYFDHRTWMYKVCIARFPETQPAFTKAFRAWEARHLDDIELVASAEAETYAAGSDQSAATAARVHDARREAMMKHYEQVPAAEFRERCDGMREEFADPEDNTGLATEDELEIVRKWQAKKQ